MNRISRVVAAIVIAPLLGIVVAASPATAAPGVNGKIAYARDGAVWVMNPDGTFRTGLVKGDAHDPEWSPDGSKILYLVGENSGGASKVWVMNADGSGQKRVFGFSVFDPAWSPDGTKIAVHDYADEGPAGVWVANADGSNTRQLSQDGNHPSWSPDGTQLAYTALGDVWVMNADGSNKTRLVQEFGNDASFDPEWSPTGSKIAFGRYQSSTDTEDVWVMNATGTGQTQLTDRAAGDRLWDSPLWSPDESKIAFEGYDASTELAAIWVMNANGSGQTQLTDDGWGPAWSPDGTKIAFSTWDNSTDHGYVWVMSANGSGKTLIDDRGSSPSWGVHPAESALAAGAFRSVFPTRLLDTRNGIGAAKAQVPGGKSVTFWVAGRAGVPLDGTGAAVLNITVTRASRGGYATAFASDAGRPNASNLNFTAGQTIANHVTVELSAEGKVTIFNGSTGPADLIADVAGWYQAGTETEAGTFTPVSPARLANKVAVAAKRTLAVSVAGIAGIPSSNVGAGVFNVTVTQPTQPGYITAFPNGTTRPNASNVNFRSGQTIANAATVKLVDGKLALFNGSTGSSRVIADVGGWFRSGVATVPGAFTPVSPARILDTRNGIGAAKAQVPAGKTVALTVAGKGGVPASNAAAAVMNVTITRTAAAGYVTAFPNGATRPGASNINFVAGQTIPNLVTVKLGGGKVTFFNGSTKPVDIVADIAGWYRN